MCGAGETSASGGQKGRKGGGRKQGKVKGRDRREDFDDTESRKELQFMGEKEVGVSSTVWDAGYHNYWYGANPLQL